MMNEIVKNFWETAHKNNDTKWLTGSNLKDVWEPMNIMNKLMPNIKILNIGVGLGNETIQLQKYKVTIDALDISETALDRVKSITRNQFLSSNINNLPTNEYDLAVSHLVTQHINDKELNNQLKYVISSLKHNGVFAMQFAYVDNANNVSQNDEYQMAGGIIRKLEDIENFVKNNNGYISWVSEPKIFDHTTPKWQYIHIKKNNINE